MSNIESNEYYGFLEFKPYGVAVVFNEAPWVISHREIVKVTWDTQRRRHEPSAQEGSASLVLVSAG
jgi:hypothetical protein